MSEFVLNAQPRDVIGKQVRALRRAGLLPAVIYGHNVKPINISLEAHAAGKVLPFVSSSQLMTVVVGDERMVVLVREKQRQPVSGKVIHVDFQAVSMNETIRITVGLDFHGESPAIKNFNAIVVVAREVVEVEALPNDLPSSIVVDMTKLTEIGAVVRVSDLVLPKGVTVLDHPEDTVVMIAPPATEAELDRKTL